MDNKSCVSVEQHMCLVCAKAYDTGAVLIDRRLQSSLDPTTLTAYGLCPEHEQLYNRGYIALVGVDPEKSKPKGNSLEMANAYQTGEIVHMRREAFDRLTPGRITDPTIPMVFVSPEIIKMLKLLETQQEG